MSVKVMTWVWDLDLDTYPKFVLLKLGDCADDAGGNAFPSVLTIAHKCGLGERTVQRILKDLTESGVLVVTANKSGGRGKKRVYRLDRETAERLHGVKGDTGAPFSREKGARETPFAGEKGAKSGEKGAIDDAKGCQS